MDDSHNLPGAPARTVPALRPNLTTRDFDDELVVVDPATNVVRIFNEVGSRIWQLIDGERSVDAIVQTLITEYDVSAEEAERATDAFLADLEARQLLKWSL